MRTITVDDFIRDPQQLIDSSRRGDAAVVTVAGEPLLLALPLQTVVDLRRALLELGVALFDREQISLGLAATIAGLPYSEMVDELGRRGVAVIRLKSGELERELAAFGE